MAGERFGPDELAALPVEETEAPVLDEAPPRAAALLSYLPHARRRWVVLAVVSGALGVLSVLLAVLHLAAQDWFGWALAVLWFAQAVTYVYVGCDEERRIRPAIAAD